MGVVVFFSHLSCLVEANHLSSDDYLGRISFACHYLHHSLLSGVCLRCGALHGLRSAEKPRVFVSLCFGYGEPLHGRLGTAKYGTGKSTTVRIQDKNGFFATLVLRFYSFYQFAAIGSHLTPSDLLMEMGFSTLIAIQSSAFFMTLYRKSLVGYQMHAIVYTTCLVFSSAAMARQFNLFRLALVFVAYMFRVNFGASKYMLWIAFSLTLTFQALSGL